jgi:hypothetical protein
VQHGDAVQLAMAIETMLQNPKLEEEMGRRGKQRVENEFRFNTFAKSFKKIGNLMRERGHNDLFLEVDDPELESKLVEVMATLIKDAERIKEGIGRTVVRNLKVMARMGVYFEEHVQQRYPDFPVRTGHLSWQDYLPPLGANLQKLVETHDEG